MKFQYIANYRGPLTRSHLCRLMGVSERGLHAWKHRPPSHRQRRDLVLLAHIRDQHRLSLGSYGRPRMTEELNELGLRVGQRRVGRLMRQNGIQIIRSRKFKRTTDSDHAFNIAPNLLQQDFTTSGPNQKWAGDITSVWTREGWIYLAVIIDLFSRRVVGWAISNRMKQDLALRALPAPEGMLILKDTFDMTRQEAEAFEAALERLNQARGLEAQAAAAADVQRALLAAYGSAEAMPEPLRAAYKAMADIVLKAGEAATTTAKLPTLLDAAANAARGAASAVAAIGDAASGAYGAVSGLVSKMGEMVQARIDAQNQLAQMGIEFSPGGQALMKYGSRAPGGSAAQNALEGRNTPKSVGALGASAGGGGGGVGALATLITDLQTEKEILDAWYAESLAMLNAATDDQLAALGGRHEAMERLEAEHAERMAVIRDMAADASLEGILGAGSMMLSALGSTNAKALKLSKAFAAAEALVSTYKGAAKELEKGTFGFASAAAVIAKGAGFVAAIKGVSDSGTGSVRGSGAGAIAQGSTGPAQTVEVKVYGMGRDKSYTGEEIAKMFDGLAEESQRRGLGGVRFTFV